MSEWSEQDREESRMRVLKSMSPKMRDEGCISAFSADTEVALIFRTNGDLFITHVGPNTWHDHKLCINIEKPIHTIFDTMETFLYYTRFDTTGTIKLKTEAELENGIHGRFIILTEALKTQFCSPIEKPTLDDWKKWLNTDLRGLVHTIIQEKGAELHQYLSYETLLEHVKFRKTQPGIWAYLTLGCVNPTRVVARFEDGHTDPFPERDGRFIMRYGSLSTVEVNVVEGRSNTNHPDKFTIEPDKPFVLDIFTATKIKRQAPFDLLW